VNAEVLLANHQQARTEPRDSIGQLSPTWRGQKSIPANKQKGNCSFKPPTGPHSPAATRLKMDKHACLLASPLLTVTLPSSQATYSTPHISEMMPKNPSAENAKNLSNSLKIGTKNAHNIPGITPITSWAQGTEFGICLAHAILRSSV
jgi:hypothetical protein